MSVYELLELFTENADVEIYDISVGNVVYSGDGEDIPAEYEDAIVQSIDSPKLSNSPRVLTVNIDTEED